ncbi:hypothetical protein [Mariniluteicoccus flavus]
MNWILLFGGIALVTVVGAVAYAVWLWRRAKALMTEVARLAERVEELAALAEQVRLPDAPATPGGADDWTQPGRGLGLPSGSSTTPPRRKRTT